MDRSSMDPTLVIDGVDRDRLRQSLMQSSVISRLRAEPPEDEAPKESPSLNEQESGGLTASTDRAATSPRGPMRALPSFSDFSAGGASSVMGQASDLTSLLRDNGDAMMSENLGTSELSTAESGGKFAYELVMFILILWNCLEIPFRLAFQPFLPLSYYVVMALIDWMFIADLIIRFFLPYLHADGFFVRSPKSAIALHYLKTWFVVDAISSIPWDFVQLCVGSASGGTWETISWYRFARLTRMIRLISISRRLVQWELTLNWDINAMFFRFLRLIIGVVLWLNACACIWWLIGDSEQLPNTWIVADHIWVNLTHADVFTKYLGAMYWTVITFTTIGYGDITPTTPGERGFLIPMALISIIIMGYAVGNVVAWIQGSEVKRNKLGDKLSIVKRYSRFRNLPEDVANKLIRSFRFQGMNDTFDDDESALLAELSPMLRAAVAIHFRETLLHRWELVRFCEKVFLTALVIRLKRETKFPSEYICVQGSQSSKFSVLVSGTIRLIRDGVSQGETSERGLTFGEPSLFREKNKYRRLASVRAVTTCELLTLTKSDMDDLRRIYPEYEIFLDAYIESLEAAVTLEEQRFLQKKYLGDKGGTGEGTSTVAKKALGLISRFRGTNRSNKQQSFEGEDLPQDEQMRNGLPEIPLVLFRREAHPCLDEPGALALEMAFHLVSVNGPAPSFSGREAVELIQAKFPVNDSDAVYLCKRLLRSGLIRQKEGPIEEFEANDVKFRFSSRVLANLESSGRFKASGPLQKASDGAPRSSQKSTVLSSLRSMAPSKNNTVGGGGGGRKSGPSSGQVPNVEQDVDEDGGDGNLQPSRNRPTPSSPPDEMVRVPIPIPTNLDRGPRSSLKVNAPVWGLSLESGRFPLVRSDQDDDVEDDDAVIEALTGAKK